MKIFKGREAIQGLSVNVIDGLSSSSGVDALSARQGKILNDRAHPINSIFISSNSTNPSEQLGGVWQLERSFYGGELIGFCSIINGASNSTVVNKDTSLSFADARIPSKVYSVTNYVPDIITGQAGTALIKPAGIVGMVDVTCIFSGFGGSGIVGFWWTGNENQLPSGVTLLNHSGAGGSALLSGPTGTNYGGHSNHLIYKVDDGVSAEFYVNPRMQPYGGDFTPASGGTKCHLIVKAYAKYGNTYVWKRTG